MHWDLLNRRHESSINLTKQIQFLDRLSKLLNRHYPLKQALEFMHFDPQLSDLSRKFSVLLIRGHPIDQCFKFLRFNPLVISYIKFSLESSHFHEHINHCTQLMKLRYDLQTRLKKSLRYPLLLLVISIVLFLGMSYYLFPSLTKTFANFGQNQSIIFINALISIFNLTLILILILILSVIVFIFYIKRLYVERRLTLIMKLPIYRYIYSSFISLQLSYQLYALLHSGKNIKEALILLKTQNEIDTVKYYASVTLKQLSKGNSFYDSIKDLPLIQEEMKWLISRSDEQGTLSYDLKQYSTILLETFEERIKQLILLIQPILYIIVGILVITIYALTIFPIYKLIQQI